MLARVTGHAYSQRIVSRLVAEDAAYVHEQTRRAARLLLGLGPHVDDPAADEVAAELEWVTFARGETVCEQGQPSDCLLFIASGRAVALHRDERTAATRVVGQLGPSETIGEMGRASCRERV